MNIHFRTRGGGIYGWGNVIRLARIADRLKKRNNEIKFFYEGDKKIESFLKKFNFKKIKLKNQISNSEEKKILNKFKIPDFFFYESLDISLNMQKFYSKRSKKFIIIDDLLDKFYFCDYLFSAQKIKNISKKLIKNKKTKFFNGWRYFPFSSELLKQARLNFKIKKKVENLIVFLGGGDYQSAYLKILYALKKINLKKITFISSYIESEFKVLCKKYFKNVSFIKSTNNIGKMFHDHDLAIVSGGYSKFEAAIINIPFISVSTQWHQIEIAESFCKEAGCKHIGHFSRVLPDEIGFEIKKLLDYNKRKIISNKLNKIKFKDGIEEILIKMKCQKKS